MVLLLSSNGYHFFYILFIIQRVLHFTSHFCFNFNRLVLTCTPTLDLNQKDFEHDDLWPIFIILMQFCFIISASPVSFIIRTHYFLYGYFIRCNYWAWACIPIASSHILMPFVSFVLCLDHSCYRSVRCTRTKSRTELSNDSWNRFQEVWHKNVFNSLKLLVVTFFAWKRSQFHKNFIVYLGKKNNFDKRLCSPKSAFHRKHLISID